jgi:hypothetical protein
LIGEDGNVFGIIGRVAGALRNAGLRDKAKEFTDRAMSSASYDDVLVLCSEYVEVR